MINNNFINAKNNIGSKMHNNYNNYYNLTIRYTYIVLNLEFKKVGKLIPICCTV